MATNSPPTRHSTGPGIDIEFLKAELTEIEKKVLLLLVRGYTPRLTACEMALSVDYVYTILRRLRAAFHCRTNAAIVASAFLSGLLATDGTMRPPQPGARREAV